MTKPATRVLGEPLDSALRSLDVALGGNSRTEEAPAPPRSRSRAPLLLGAAAAAVLVGGVILILPATTASASETPSESTPGDLTSAEISAVTTACRAEYSRGSAEPLPDLDMSRLVTTERSGDQVLVLYAWPVTSVDKPATAIIDCLATLPPQAETPTWVAPGWVGAQAVGARSIDLSLSRGPGMGGTYATLSGAVGADIAEITVHEDGLDIPAVVGHGVAYAWWRSTMPAEQLSLPPGSAGHGTVTITYTDGSVDTRPWFETAARPTAPRESGGG